MPSDLTESSLANSHLQTSPPSLPVSPSPTLQPSRRSSWNKVSPSTGSVKGLSDSSESVDSHQKVDDLEKGERSDQPFNNIPDLKRKEENAAGSDKKDNTMHPHGHDVYPGSGTPSDPYILSFTPTDPSNPLNLPNWRKWIITFTVGIATLCVAFASSAFSGGYIEMIVYFNSNAEVITLGLTFFVIGFACGPLIWAPLSEMYGRRTIFFWSYIPFTLFHIGCALATNLQTLLICRLFAGIFGSSPLANAGGTVSDIFDVRQRALGMSLFALAPFLGPILGPIGGGFAAEAMGWRSTFWIMFIFSAVMVVATFFLVPETYAPALLRQKAAKLTKEAKERGEEKVYVAIYDVGSNQSFRQKMTVSLLRPFKMLMLDLICFLFALYAALVYGILYLMFEAFPIVFEEGRGWSSGVGGLAFVGIGIGVVSGALFNIYLNNRYVRALDASPSGTLPPEARLTGCMIGAIALPVGLFWFSWTTFPSIPWIVPIMASAPFGFGMILVFLSMTVYLVDSYLMFAASTLAANSVLRSCFGAVFPLFARQMYEALGNQWASTLISFLALACTPIPFLFYRYGATIRSKSKFAPMESKKEKEVEQFEEEEQIREENEKATV